jgi:hypothetical protein
LNRMGGLPALVADLSIHVPAAHPHAVIYRNRHEGNDQTQQAAAATVISVFDPRDEHAARQIAWAVIRGIVPSITPLTSLAADGHATAQRRQACTCGFDLHVNAIMRVKRVRQDSTKSSSRTCRMLHGARMLSLGVSCSCKILVPCTTLAETTPHAP